MKIPGNAAKFRWFGLISIVALLAALATLYPAARGNRVYAWQEKEAPRPNAGDQATSLNDQTDLNVTVYNSNIALIRDVRNLALPSGTFRLKFMDIAATVNPATVHFRSLNEPDKLGVIEQNCEAPSQIRRQGGHAGSVVPGKRHDQTRRNQSHAAFR